MIHIKLRGVWYRIWDRGYVGDLGCLDRSHDFFFILYALLMKRFQNFYTLGGQKFSSPSLVSTVGLFKGILTKMCHYIGEGEVRGGYQPLPLYVFGVYLI